MFYIVAHLLGLTVFLAGSMGLVSYAYFVKVRCDPLASKFIKNPNQVCDILRLYLDFYCVKENYFMVLFKVHTIRLICR